ncbi:MAG: hypothetical protein QOE66_208, partial [Chloroflexota bacterium]|nr:hypothetical protein [Chloroflexota bacterium]
IDSIDRGHGHQKKTAGLLLDGKVRRSRLSFFMRGDQLRINPAGARADLSGAIGAEAGIARAAPTGRVGIQRGQHAQQGGTPTGAGRLAAATHPGHGPRPDKTIVHRCSSLGIRLAHQTSPPKDDVPSIAGTRPPIRCAEKNPNPTRPPHAVLTSVPDVRGEHHRGGSPSKLQPKPSTFPAPTREASDCLNFERRLVGVLL